MRDLTLRRWLAWVMLGLLAQFGPLGPGLFPECLGHSAAGRAMQGAPMPAEAPASAHGGHLPPTEASGHALHAGMGTEDEGQSGCCSGLCCCDLATGMPAQATQLGVSQRVATAWAVSAPRRADVSRLDHLGLPFATAPPA
ncbi:MAG: hypothetical protein R3E10_18580 [Gemmatimonadota bacterium]